VILRRLLAVVPIVFLVSFGVFGLETLLPGDAAVTVAGENASPETIAEIRSNLGLDHSVPRRFIDWLGGALHGDLGTSLFTHAAVTKTIGNAWVITFALVLGALVIALLVSPVLALVAASRSGRPLDRLITVLASIGTGIPDFVVGMFMLLVFGVMLGWLPLTGYVPLARGGLGVWLSHMVMPVLALSLPMTASLTRQLRFSLADTLAQPYIRTAYAKGLADRVVLVKHALRAAAPAAVSVFGVYVARLLGGVVIVESVFQLPGLGNAMVTGLLNRDFPVIQGVIPLLVLVAVCANVAADALNMVLRPRTAIAIREVRKAPA
jgi:peptide/nickel transport system permease protein